MCWQLGWKCWKWIRSKQSPEEAGTKSRDGGGARRVIRLWRISEMYLKLPNPALCEYMWIQYESSLSDGPQALTFCCGSQSVRGAAVKTCCRRCRTRPWCSHVLTACAVRWHKSLKENVFVWFVVVVFFHTCLSQLATDTEGSKRTEKEETVNTVSMPVQGHSHGMVTMEEKSCPG